jgi:hypothetical protein
MMDVEESKREKMLSKMWESYRYRGHVNPGSPIDLKNDHILMIVSHDNFMPK